ncbi:hypothetical protein Q3G72_015027 [Acer saccharum]|nr:hypothetical protein Q3G72_015027 [Acer saccharum]
MSRLSLVLIGLLSLALLMAWSVPLRFCSRFQTCLLWLADSGISTMDHTRRATWNSKRSYEVRPESEVKAGAARADCDGAASAAPRFEACRAGSVHSLKLMSLGWRHRSGGLTSQAGLRRISTSFQKTR